MPAPATRALLACLTLTLACGDTSAGSGGSTTNASATNASTTTATSSSTTSTAADTGTTSAPTTSSASASASSGDAPTTGAIDSTGTTSTNTSTNTTGEPASTGPDSTSTTSTTGTSTTTGGNGLPPPAPDMAAGCAVCDCCDPWPISWAPVPEATHYVVRWKCSINPEQVHDVGSKTAIADVCNDIDMCNGMCAFTVGYIKVEACNGNGCSMSIAIPPAEAPITCGGGCCC